MELTADNVAQIYNICTYTAADYQAEAKPLIILLTDKMGAVFHRQRLDSQRPVIEELLVQLPEDFQHQNQGLDGQSLLQGQLNYRQEPWTASLLDVEKLFLLGVAVGMVRMPYPAELWTCFPDGMPYFQITP